jgi:hypothetical protein
VADDQLRLEQRLTGLDRVRDRVPEGGLDLGVERVDPDR